MRKPRSERQRWVKVFTLTQPWPNEEGGKRARAQHDELLAVVKAFAAVGRVIRIEPSKFGEALVFKARKA